MRMFYDFAQIILLALAIYAEKRFHITNMNILCVVGILCAWLIIQRFLYALSRGSEEYKKNKKTVDNDYIMPRPLSATERRIADNQRIVKRNFYNWEDEE